MFWLIRKLFRKRKPKSIDAVAAKAPRISMARKPRPEWEKALLASLEENNLAPTDEVILHAFDLYQEELYAPILERRLAVTNLHAEIVADVAILQALVPDLIDRALARHPFEFSRIIEHKEDR